MTMYITYRPGLLATPWFTAEDPVHVGAYERDITDLRSSQPMYGFWDGVCWYQCAHSPERAEELYERGYESCYQYTNPAQRWRGLSENRS